MASGTETWRLAAPSWGATAAFFLRPLIQVFWVKVNPFEKIAGPNRNGKSTSMVLFQLDGQLIGCPIESIFRGLVDRAMPSERGEFCQRCGFTPANLISPAGQSLIVFAAGWRPQAVARQFQQLHDLQFYLLPVR